MGHQGGELASLVQAGPEQTRDHLDDSLGSQESMVLLGCNEQKMALVSKPDQIHPGISFPCNRTTLSANPDKLKTVRVVLVGDFVRSNSC